MGARVGTVLSEAGRTVCCMAKTQTRPSHRCTECGWTTVRWVGRCGECQAWGSVMEVGAPRLAEVKAATPTRRATRIKDVDADAAARVRTGVGELDRVLGDGLVPGAVVLLAGEPGVGKSTLLLEVAAQWAKAGRTTLYVTGEESAAQVRLRAGRTDALADELYLAAETDLGTVLGHVEEVRPSLLVVDSVQTIGTAEADGSPGGVTQIREVTAALIRVAKQRDMAVIIIGHVTKDGNIAGPRLLEHLVDVVLAFEGDRHSGLPADPGDQEPVRSGRRGRLLRDGRGRHRRGVRPLGPVHLPPRGAGAGHLRHRHDGGPSTAAGRAAGAWPASRRCRCPGAPCTGSTRVGWSMVLAVLERRARVRLHDSDVYVSTVGGARVVDPSADLAAAVAVASSALDVRLTQRCVAIGEVGLAGELRRVPGLERRLAEAARLGFTEAVIPSDARQSEQIAMSRHGLLIHAVPTVADALRPSGHPPGPGPSGGRTLTRITPIGRRPRPRGFCLRWRTEQRHERSRSRDGTKRGAGRYGAEPSARLPGAGRAGNPVAGWVRADPARPYGCAGGARSRSRGAGPVHRWLRARCPVHRRRRCGSWPRWTARSCWTPAPTKIMRAGVHLMPDASIFTAETGTRHRTADRVARQTGVPVIAVSASMATISLYVDAYRQFVENPDQILARANQALQTLERYRSRLREATTRLSALEVEDQVTVRDVAAVAQRLEMVHRLDLELSEYAAELGTEGRLLALQMHELTTGLTELGGLLEKDYRPGDLPAERPTAAPRPVAPAERSAATRPSVWASCPHSTPPSCWICCWWPGRSASPPPTSSTARSPPAATGRWPRSTGCPGRSGERLIEHFGSLQALFAASRADLQEVEGVGEQRARAIRDGLVRVAESAYADPAT